MAVTTIVNITHAETTAQQGEYLGAPASAPREACNDLARYLRALASGAQSGTVTIGEDDAVAASGTATIVSAVATDAVTINGVAFTAIANGGTPTGNQWCVGAGGTANADSATALAAAINAAATAKVAGYVTASAAANVVTITAVHAGVSGNMFTLTDTGNTITVTGSGFLTGGAERTAPTSYSL